METPTTPEEFINNEPSLRDLINHVAKYKATKEEEYVYTYDMSVDVLNNYYIGAINYQYYLGGQFKLNLDEPISEDVINSAKKLIIEKNKSYGEPANFLEYISIENAKKDFENIQRIIEQYYKIEMHELYRPADPTDPNDRGGEMYQLVERYTMIGK